MDKNKQKILELFACDYDRLAADIVATIKEDLLNLGVAEDKINSIYAEFEDQHDGQSMDIYINYHQLSGLSIYYTGASEAVDENTSERGSLPEYQALVDYNSGDYDSDIRECLEEYQCFYAIQELFSYYTRQHREAVLKLFIKKFKLGV